jgi:predicted flap endonuclease-1-like 5' DNA nuclease
MWSELFKRWMDMMTWWLPQQRSGSEASTSDKGAAAAPSQSTQAREQPSQSEAGSSASDQAKNATSGSGSQASASPASGEAEAAPAASSSDDLTDIKGIGPSIRDRLQDAGINSFRDLASADAAKLTEQLKAKTVVSQKRVQQWIDEARARNG